MFLEIIGGWEEDSGLKRIFGINYCKIIRWIESIIVGEEVFVGEEWVVLEGGR